MPPRPVSAAGCGCSSSLLCFSFPAGWHLQDGPSRCHGCARECKEWFKPWHSSAALDLLLIQGKTPQIVSLAQPLARQRGAFPTAPPKWDSIPTLASLG